MAQHRSAIFFIFFTLLIDVIGFGILIPVFPQMLAEMNGVSVSEASTYGGFLLFVFALAQFVCSPIMGALSDQYGRRPVLLFSLLGFSIDYLILAFAPSYSWLVVGRILAGVTGASFTTASSYIADISTDENRSKNFGMIGAAFGLGFIVGPFLGGILGDYSLKLPFYVTAGLSFANFLFGFFALPESLSAENRRPFDWRRASPWGSLKEILKYKTIGYLLIAYVLLFIGSHAVQSTWSYFTTYRFGWDGKMVGYSLALVGILVAIVQAGLAQKIANIIGVPRAIVIGFALYSIGMFMFAFSAQSWMMFVSLIPYCFGGIAMPNLQAYMTSQVPSNQQGELQGGLTSIGSVTMIIGPLMMTNIFYAFTKDSAPFKLPGAAFVLGGVLMGISCLITMRLLKTKQF
jgi:MFS transporter, DHA1 family, tetracycline resistance protein